MKYLIIILLALALPAEARVVEYTMTCRDMSSDLVLEMNTRIKKDGWQPLGGAFLGSSSGFCQAMVKYGN